MTKYVVDEARLSGEPANIRPIWTNKSLVRAVFQGQIPFNVEQWNNQLNAPFIHPIKPFPDLSLSPTVICVKLSSAAIPPVRFILILYT